MKLPPLQPALTAPVHNNQRLFSDHYLNVTLPGLPAWRQLADEARPVMLQVAGILNAYKPSANEQQTEHDLVRPILTALGHTFEVSSQPRHTPRHQDPLENRVPGFQIAFYLQHSGLPRGILTNGRLWRLYHRDSAHKLDRFYEVDLSARGKPGLPISAPVTSG